MHPVGDPGEFILTKPRVRWQRASQDGYLEVTMAFQGSNGTPFLVAGDMCTTPENMPFSGVRCLDAFSGRRSTSKQVRVQCVG